MKQQLAFLCLFLTAWFCLPAQTRQHKDVLHLQVPFTPQAVLIGGEPTIYYELLVTNAGDRPVRLQKLELVTPSGTVIRYYDSSELSRRYGRRPEDKKDTGSTLLPGATVVFYLEAGLSKAAARQFTHRLSFKEAGDRRAPSPWAAGAVLQHISPTTRIIGPPLGQGYWVAVYDPSWESGHRRVIYAPDGVNRIPGRFAIDFIRLDEEGKYTTADENEIRNWYGYGAPVIAVADGVVAAVRDDFSESNTLSDHPRYSADKATGNYVALDIGQGHYAFYEHLQPHSIRVKAGQPVKKGEVIAALGFTGQTTGPHLHFHIANANSPLEAEGIPFAFERFTLTGTYPDFSQFGNTRWKPVGPTTILNERPAPNTVIRF